MIINNMPLSNLLFSLLGRIAALASDSGLLLHTEVAWAVDLPVCLSVLVK